MQVGAAAPTAFAWSLTSCWMPLWVSFARQEELSMLRHQRSAYHAQCHACWGRGGGLTAPGSRRGGCSEEESYSRTAVGFLYLSNMTRLSHPVQGRTYKKSEVIATGNLLYKNNRGKKVGAELRVFVQQTQTSKTEWPGGALQAPALQLKLHRTKKPERWSSSGVIKDADVCWEKLAVVAGVASQQI